MYYLSKEVYKIIWILTISLHKHSQQNRLFLPHLLVHFLLPLILGVLLLIVLVGVSGFYLTKKQSTTSSVKNTIPTVFPSSKIVEDEGLLLNIGGGKNVFHLVEPPTCQHGEGPREIAKRVSGKFIVESKNIDLFSFQYQLVKVSGSLENEKRERLVVCLKNPCPPV